MGLSTYLHYATSQSTIHILSYGILTGTTIWHSFINGPVAYKTLPRQQFGNLQSKLFPPFFTLQAITAGICFWTSYNSVSGTYNELVALGGVAASGLLNLLLVGPWTTGIMNQRHKLERSSGTKYTDSDIGEDMKQLNTQFAIAHSVSSIINLAAVAAILVHGIHLGHKLNLIEAYSGVEAGCAYFRVGKACTEFGIKNVNDIN